MTIRRTLTLALLALLLLVAGSTMSIWLMPLGGDYAEEYRPGSSAHLANQESWNSSWTNLLPEEYAEGIAKPDAGAPGAFQRTRGLDIIAEEPSQPAGSSWARWRQRVFALPRTDGPTSPANHDADEATDRGGIEESTPYLAADEWDDGDSGGYIQELSIDQGDSELPQEPKKQCGCPASWR